MPAKLSICMIVRDEADVLPRCLDSIKGLADEIVAIDTGSTDGSQEILRRAGAKVVEMAWTGDFGEARTAAIREASGEWILFIDADEALEPTTAQNLRILLVDLDQPVSFEVPILSYLDDDESGETTMSWMPRLFNRPNDHFYFGRLHEQLIGSKAVRLDPTVLSLRHWGYQQSRIAAKGKEARNVSLLNAEIEAEGDTLRSALYIAAATQDPAETLVHAEKALTLLPEDTAAPAAITTIASLIIKAHNQLGQWDEAVERATGLLDRFAGLEGEAQYWCLLGDAHVGRGHDDEAEQAYRRAMALVQGHRSLQSVWSEAVPANASMALASLCLKRGAADEARQILESALALPRIGMAAVAQLKGALANVLAGSGELATAWSMATAAIETTPALRAKIANGFMEQGNIVLAMRMMAPILDPVSLRDRATTLAASLLGDQRAIDLLEWLLDEHGEDGPTRVNLGLHWLALDEPEKAQQAIAEGLGEPQDAVVVALRLAYFEQVLDRLDTAEARLSVIVQAAADAGETGWLAEALTQWGNLAFQRQQWDKAADLLAELVNLKPHDAYAHYALASARFGQGDLQAARQGYERTLLIDPTFAGAQQGLTNLESVIKAGIAPLGPA